MPTLRDSTLYDRIANKKWIQPARDFQGRTVRAMIDITIISAVIGDSYNCNILPANCEVIDAYIMTDGLGGAVIVQLGDSGVIDRYSLSTTFAAAEANARIKMSGLRYRPALDTIIVATMSVAAPTVGKLVKGWVEFVPGE